MTDPTMQPGEDIVIIGGTRYRLEDAVAQGLIEVKPKTTAKGKVAKAVNTRARSPRCDKATNVDEVDEGGVA